MLDISDKLNEYILNHTEKEDDLLQELFRQTHLKVFHPRMISGHLQGKVLEMLCKMIKPQYILEVGAYTGYATICMAKGLGENGQLHSIEINDEIIEFTQAFINKTEVKDKINLHVGDALQIIPTLDMQFDFVFIDGNNKDYLNYYKLVFDRVSEGGFIIADNVLWSGKVLADTIESNDHFTKGILEFNDFVQNDSRVENVLFPIRDGLMVVRKK